MSINYNSLYTYYIVKIHAILVLDILLLFVALIISMDKKIIRFLLLLYNKKFSHLCLFIKVLHS